MKMTNEHEDVTDILNRAVPIEEFQRQRRGKWFHGMSDKEKEERLEKVRSSIEQFGNVAVTSRDDFAKLFGYIGDAKFHSLASYVWSHRNDWGIDISQKTETVDVEDPDTGEIVQESRTIAVIMSLLR